MSDETLRERERAAAAAPDDITASARLESEQERAGRPLSSPVRTTLLSRLGAVLTAAVRRRCPFIVLRAGRARSGRLYSREVIAAAVETLRPRLASRTLLIGPADETLGGRPLLLSSATHILVDAAADPETGDLRIAVEPLPPDAFARALAALPGARSDGRFAFSFSARGTGSVVRRADGVEVVQPDFRIAGVDVSAEPLGPAVSDFVRMALPLIERAAARRVRDDAVQTIERDPGPYERLRADINAHRVVLYDGSRLADELRLPPEAPYGECPDCGAPRRPAWAAGPGDSPPPLECPACRSRVHFAMLDRLYPRPTLPPAGLPSDREPGPVLYFRPPEPPR